MPHPLTFMPISICERSAKGTSLVTSSHSNTAKLHMSADLLLMSSGLFCRAEDETKRDMENHEHNGTTHRNYFYSLMRATHQMNSIMNIRERLNYIAQDVFD